jgi:serine/threonine protein phosphatase 1
MNSRTFAIGDIHGALKALQQIIQLIKPKQDDTLIFLGDYVDGWSQSAQVIDYLITLDETYNCIFIRGNHDTWCEDWLQGKPANETWLYHGGQATVESYRTISAEQKDRHLEFFNRMKNYYVDEQNRLFIHAGFSSMEGPGKEQDESDYCWDRTLWKMALTMDNTTMKDSRRLTLFKEIYIGHTPTLYYDVYTPMQGCNVWNIDTGAAFHGKLSAINIDTKEYWQSDTVQQLYPNERGRNKS